MNTKNETSMIRFEGVSKFYGENEVVSNLCAEIHRGEFVTVIGSSGSGKTTALKMVNALIQPDQGAVWVDGENIAQVDHIMLRRHIGYVIQGTGLFPHMNVWKNIAYVPNLLNKSDKERTRRAVSRLMDVMGLEPDMAARYPSELSGGQQQRVGIARALAASPDILLMDEPFGAVDGITRHMLQNEILRIHRDLNVTILFVTHDIDEAFKLGQRVMIMDRGKLLQFSTPAEIQQQPADTFVSALVGLA
jgi:ABC-type proline/glycine betaine transport systems, ATPase components